MIFRSLTLSNYRVFKDNHAIDLAPRKEGVNTKPIILFGGLNGAGKTSILTGIRLALLGSRAIGRGVSRNEYHEYLKQQINNKALQEDEASNTLISLTFTHTHQGVHSSYRIERNWSLSQVESVKLYKNDQLESSLSSEQVQSFLAEIIPPRIANLFFFDGEKIADLAEDSTGTYLKEAVQQLLGIDIVNRLSDDLDLYIKQLTKDHAKSATQLEISVIEHEKKELLIRANKAREEGDKVNSKLTDIERIVNSL
ncbi:TPA: DNA sulfur modification protein DndD, partial [Candidatus Poribacteria bacterium]|nr:DNA sulfur modification protein DndD [Candidatus Poribacteria bacterium]